MPDIENAPDVDKENGDSSRNLDDPVNDGHEPRKVIDAMNWSVWMKLYHTAIPCFLAFLM